MKVQPQNQSQPQQRGSSSAKSAGVSNLVHPILNLQRTIGNLAVQRLLHGNPGDLEKASHNFSLGRIYSGPVQLEPETREAQRLIPHERVQVVQQQRDTGVLQRQPASLRPLTPIRIKELEGLLAGSYFDEAVNRLVGYKFFDNEINLDLLENKKMSFDSSLTSSDATTAMPRWDYINDKAEPARVRIGPSAFSSVPYLYSVIMHEYQHVLWQQTLSHQNQSHQAHDQSFVAPDEVEAGAWELLNAAETGVAQLPDKVAQIWTNLNDFFWKLDPQVQAKERQLVLQAFQKAKTFTKGSQVTLVPFKRPSP